MKQPRAKNQSINPSESSKDSKLFLLIGSALVLLIFITILNVDCPTSFQLYFFNAIIALGFALIAFGIRGFLTVEIKNKLDSLGSYKIAAGGGFALLVLMLYLNPVKWIKSEDCFGTKSVIAHVKRNDGKYLSDVVVRLKIGKQLLTPKKTNNEGEVIFDNINFKDLDDSITLEPEDPRLLVLSQNAYTFNSSDEIVFTVDYLPDTTWITGCLVTNDDKALQGAKLIFNQEFECITNSNGCYKIGLPFEDGEIVEIRVMVDGKIRKQRNQILSNQVPINFTIDLPEQ